jgi:hypothetical protein
MWEGLIVIVLSCVYLFALYKLFEDGKEADSKQKESFQGKAG